MFGYPTTIGIKHREATNCVKFCPLPVKIRGEGRKKIKCHFCFPVNRQNISQQIVCSGVKISYMFQEQKTGEERPSAQKHMIDQAGQARPLQQAARTRSIDFHWRGQIKLQERTHLIFMSLKAYRKGGSPLCDTLMQLVEHNCKIKHKERLNCVVHRPQEINRRAIALLIYAMPLPVFRLQKDKTRDPSLNSLLFIKIQKCHYSPLLVSLKEVLLLFFFLRKSNSYPSFVLSSNQANRSKGADK